MRQLSAEFSAAPAAAAAVPNGASSRRRIVQAARRAARRLERRTNAAGAGQVRFMSLATGGAARALIDDRAERPREVVDDAGDGALARVALGADDAAGLA